MLPGHERWLAFQTQTKVNGYPDRVASSSWPSMLRFQKNSPVPYKQMTVRCSAGGPIDVTSFDI